MFLRYFIMIGLSMLLAACSTGRYAGNDYASNQANQAATPTEMGVRYLLGRGVQQDNEKAFHYFKQADDEPLAQNELGYMYAAGKGTEQDYTKALFYYEKAANQGLASAEFNVGMLNLYGLGTPPNKEAAMTWFKKSAAKGFEPAKRALAKSQVQA